MDLDLAILGQIPINYQVYVQQIREEYSRYSDSEYREGRRAVLRTLLARGKIFQTANFQKFLGENAVRNISNELEHLQY